MGTKLHIIGYIACRLCSWSIFIDHSNTLGAELKYPHDIILIQVYSFLIFLSYRLELCSDEVDVQAAFYNMFVNLTHYQIILHFDALKICSCGKHCEKRRKDRTHNQQVMGPTHSPVSHP